MFFSKQLKMSGHRGYEFLELWCWNLVPFLPDKQANMWLQYVVSHCPAEIHKTFPEIDVVWRGAYVALKPLCTFQH